MFKVKSFSSIGRLWISGLQGAAGLDDGIDDRECAVAGFCFDTKAWSDVGELEPVKVTADYPKK